MLFFLCLSIVEVSHRFLNCSDERENLITFLFLKNFFLLDLAPPGGGSLNHQYFLNFDLLSVSTTIFFNKLDLCATVPVLPIFVTCDIGRESLIFFILFSVGFLVARIVNLQIFNSTPYVAAFFQSVDLAFGCGIIRGIEHSLILCTHVLLVPSIFMFRRFFQTTTLSFHREVGPSLTLCASVLLNFLCFVIVNFLGLGLPPPGGRIVNHLILCLNFLIAAFFQITTLFLSHNIDHN